ncbi:MAG: PIG-L family deacetylase [Dehalococcoidia bacterium]|nr:PIG-L family deacetylase [Dehalococcoidia bacterium]
MPTLVAVIPHPDDESYSFGGTIALAVRSGWRAVVLCLSAGEGGERHDRPPAAPRSTAVTRLEELARSCSILGAVPLHWRLPDGGFARAPGQSSKLARLFTELGPSLVLALGADGAYGHPDHLATHRWVLRAWHSMRDPRPALLLSAFPPGLFLPQYQKCADGGLLGSPPSLAPGDIGASAPHYSVAIRPVRETKLAAIAAHRSQLPGGDPETLFPPGVVRALLDSECFVDARGYRDKATAALLTGFEASAG